ncbi:Calcineurin-binding protein cabin-1 [Halotydeus destructor]|nr:Calcineurin-binding protein cabin-1 [Halotydeus destructor]
MLKIKALNESTSSESDGDDESAEMKLTREAREEKLHSLYRESLHYLKDGQVAEAKETLIKLNDQLKSNDHQGMLSANQLRFSVCKNLGLLVPDNINYFLDALKIDSTDIPLWIKTGQRAYTQLRDYQLARNCFEAAHDLSPRNWIVIDKLIDCYFVLHDLYSCFNLCAEAFKRDANYPKAKWLIYETCRLHPPLKMSVTPCLEKLLSLNASETEQYEKLMSEYRMLKLKRKEDQMEDEIRSMPKHQCFSVDFHVTNSAFGLVGRQLLELWKKMDADKIPVFAPIDIVITNQLELSEKNSKSGDASKDETSSDCMNEQKADVVSMECNVLEVDEKEIQDDRDKKCSTPAEKIESEHSYSKRSTPVSRRQSENFDIMSHNPEIIKESIDDVVKTVISELIRQVVEPHIKLQDGASISISKKQSPTPKASSEPSASSSSSSEEDEEESNSRAKSRDRSQRKRTQRSDSFPTEFLDKRRSTRIQKQQTKGVKNGRSDLYESLVGLLPEMMQERCLFDCMRSEDTSSFAFNSKATEIGSFKRYVAKLRAYRDSKRTVYIDDLIADYLKEFAVNAYKMNMSPVFPELYKIHRKNTRLPFGPFAQIGRDIDVEELWLILSATEFRFSLKETIFLQQVIGRLEHTIESDLFKQFSIRLTVLLAVKEKDESALKELYDDLIGGEHLEGPEVERNVEMISVAMAKCLISLHYRNDPLKIGSLGRYEDFVDVVISVIETGRYDELMNFLV